MFKNIFCFKMNKNAYICGRTTPLASFGVGCPKCRRLIIHKNNRVCNVIRLMLINHSHIRTAPIIGIRRHKLFTDGDGVTTLVAFYGCPLHCKYCINSQCNATGGVKELLTPQQLYDKVKIDDIYFLVTGGGITFGGGEPLLRSDFIKEFREICGNKWKIYIETSLNVDKQCVAQLVDVIDHWIIDIKDWTNEIYNNYTGCDNKLVIENLRYLLSKGCAGKIIVRVPSIPEYNNKTDIAYTIDKLNRFGINSIDQFEYIKDVESIHKRDNRPHKAGINSGKFKCEVLKSIRTYAAEYNGIQYKPHKCAHKVCTTGCCTLCDHELQWVTKEYYKLKKRKYV